MLPVFLLERGAMNVDFSRTAMAAILAISLAGPAFSQDGFLAGSAPTSPETPAARAPMPDLIVTHGEVSPQGGDQVIVGRVFERFTWGHRTKNAGDAASLRSETVVEIGSRTPGGAALSVPRLAPGTSRLATGSFTVNFRTWEFGTYPTKICADRLDVVTESREGNNCRALAPIHLVPSRLSGRVTGKIESLPPVKTFDLSWVADVTYDLSRIHSVDRVYIDYTFSEVSVIYNVHGTDSIGCTYRGSRTDTPPVQGVRLWFGERGWYRAENAVTQGFRIRVTQTCPDSDPFIFNQPVAGAWFTTGGFRQFQTPGLEALRGRFIDSSSGVKKTTISWNLEAE
jgi:hypothetical protein